MEKQNNNRQNQRGKQRDNKPKEFKNVYSLCQITKRISLPVTAIGKNLHQTIEETISKMISGKCIVEGFVKPNSIRVITFSSGIVISDNVIFDVVFNCDICYPVAGMNLNCVATAVTKGGITAESADESPSPYILQVARDHYYANDYFNSIEQGDKFVARVIAQRFELYDKRVSIIADIVPPQSSMKENKPLLIIDG